MKDLRYLFLISQTKPKEYFIFGKRETISNLKVPEVDLLFILINLLFQEMGFKFRYHGY